MSVSSNETDIYTHIYIIFIFVVFINRFYFFVHFSSLRSIHFVQQHTAINNSKITNNLLHMRGKHWRNQTATTTKRKWKKRPTEILIEIVDSVLILVIGRRKAARKSHQSYAGKFQKQILKWLRSSTFTVPVEWFFIVESFATKCANVTSQVYVCAWESYSYEF